LRTRLPVTFWTMTAAALAIAGVPPLSGFFSKDEILYSAFAGANARPILGVVGLVAAALTAYYTGRLVCLTFLGESRVSPEAAHHLHESPPVMTVPLAVLAVGAVVGGFLPVPALLGHTGEGGPPLALVVRPLFAAADLGARGIDPKLIDGVVNGTGVLVAATSGLWRRVQTGNVQHYALSFLIGALLLLGYYVGR